MSRVLLPLEILEGESVDQGLVDLLADDHVVLLGFHRIPEQTAPEQAEESFGDRAREKLDDVADALEAAGASVDERLVFTHDADQTRERVARETDCEAVLATGPAMAVDRLLVVVHPAADAERIAAFAADQVAGTDRDVVLLSLTPDETVERESLATARDVIADAGVPDDRVTVHERVTDNHLDAIVAAATDVDLVVVGERDPSALDLLLGEFVDRVRSETVAPVAVVRSVGRNE